MSSRKEEKELRRQERLAVEAQAKAEETRRRRLMTAGFVLLIAGAIAAAVFVVPDAMNKDGGGAKPKASSAGGAKIPPPSQRDLSKAAAAAGCELKSFPSYGQEHTTQPVHYKTNPPTSGPHNPVPALDGIYDPQNAPSAEHTVHALEHGRIDVQYAPGTPRQRISQLETLASEPLNGKAAYKVLLFQNQTKMPYEVAATAWMHLLGCKRFTPAVFDALRDFRETYVDKGPEPGIPPNN